MTRPLKSARDASEMTAALIDRAAALVEAAHRAGADAADAVVVSGQSLGVDVREGKIEETTRSENDSFSLRVFIGARSAAISAGDAGAVEALAERAVAMAKVAPEDPYAGLADTSRLATQFPELDLFDETPIDVAALSNLAREAEDAALAVTGTTKSSGASAGWGTGGLVLVTSGGFCGSYRASSFSNSVSVIAGEGTGMERDYDFDSKHHRADLRSATEIGHAAGERAVRRLNPQKLKSQTLSVIYDPRVATGLVGHLAAAANGASVARKTSFLRGDLGKAVFRPNVTITDDPHRLRGLASQPFDGEGVGASSMDIVRNGVLTAWFLDTATARELGLETNGRAQRGGANPSPGRTNLTLLAGEKSPAEMMKDIKTGLYVTELIGSGVNMVTGDYSRGASGFWIEDGELAYSVSGVTIAGNLRDMFARMIPANDLVYRFSTNAPTILIERMALAGR
ncbi:MAG: TldD/PmbA family protein [Rhizobiales bacterium]|nr:TldD/PmbA family protein [Hyphomicrobiales bacterium]